MPVPSAFAHDLLPLLLDHVRQGRFQRSFAFVTGAAGLASMVEVAQEHYTGSFGQRVMVTPPLCCLILAVAGFGGAVFPAVAQAWLPWAALLLVADCAVGFGFHLRGVARKPGGWRRNVVTNLVMGPPILAPLVLSMASVFGLIAANLAPEQAASGPPSATLETIRLCCAAATGFYAALNGCEALYSHYKNRFSRRAQWTPIVLAPLLAVAAALDTALPGPLRLPLEVLSSLAILAGVTGAGFHLYGVIRRPGGLPQLFYNFIYGPPLFAPLLFAATGLLGLLATQIGYTP